MRAKGRNIIVVGTSSGGLEALDALIGQLPAGLRASIFIVQQMAPENTGTALLHRLGRHRAFRCSLAKNLRMFEERKNLLNKLSRTASSPAQKRSYAEKAKATDIHIERIRAMLVSAAPQAMGQ